MTEAIDRPIFIVGSGRSGTTIFLSLLAGHKNLGWISNYIRRYPEWLKLARLNRFYKIPALVKHYKDKRWFPKPAEAPRLWDRFHPVNNSSGSPLLTDENSHQANIDGLKNYISSIMHYSGDTRFIVKETRFTRRIRYLHKLFPDALFIHLIRDGRAVTNSLLKVDWWPSLPIWWANGKTPVQLQQKGMDPVQIAAQMWRIEVERVLFDKDFIPQSQYMEIRYEQLIQDPMAAMARVLGFCSLDDYPGFDAHVKALKIENKNCKWVENFTPKQIASIENKIGSFLASLDYS